MRCDLMLSTTLFLGREGLRLAFVRCDPGGPDTPSSRRKRQRLVNLAWLSAPLGLCLTAAVAGLYLMLNPGENALRRRTALLYCAGGALESVVEPLFILAQASMQTTVRAQAEGTAALIRGLATYGCMVWFQLGVVSFGVAQLLHGLAIAACYAAFFFLGSSDGACERRKACGFVAASDLFPGPLPPLLNKKDEGDGEATAAAAAAAVTARPSSLGKGRGGVSSLSFYESWFGDGECSESLRMALSFSGQSAFKHLLTEGDRIVLSMGATLHDQVDMLV